MMARYVPAPLAPPRVTRRRIPKGYKGTAHTAAEMVRLIHEGAKDFYVRQRAIDILLARGVKPKDYVGEINALFEWVQRNVRYTKDPFRVEVLHSARRMLEVKAGDCDDMAIVLGSLIKSVGHPVRLVLTGPDATRPRLFSHVYLEAFYRGRWIPLDATMHYPIGWAPCVPVRSSVAVDAAPGLAEPTAGLEGLDAGVADGARLYEAFSGAPAMRVERMAHDRLVPRVVVELGKLAGLIYDSDKWRPGRTRRFVHFFQAPPRLASNAAGDRLYIVGGRFRVTARGIEG